jgi:hypothetical protein
VVASASGTASAVADAAEAAFRVEVLDLMHLSIFSMVLGIAFLLSLVALAAIAVAARR